MLAAHDLDRFMPGYITALRHLPTQNNNECRHFRYLTATLSLQPPPSRIRIQKPGYHQINPKDIFNRQPAYMGRVFSKSMIIISLNRTTFDKHSIQFATPLKYPLMPH